MSSLAPSPNDLTRQQLDELDALLQRMLSLPLNAPPAPVPTPLTPPASVLPAPSVSLPAGWRADPAAHPAPRPAFAATAEGDEELLEQVAAMAAPLGATTAARPYAPPAPPAPAVAAPAFAEPPRLFSGPSADTGVPPSAGPLRGVDAPALPNGYRPPAAPTPPPAPVLSDPFPPADEPLAELTPAAGAAARPAAPAGDRVPVPLWPLFGVNWVLELLLGLLGPVGTVAAYPAVKHLLGVTGLGLLAGAGAWTARGLGYIAW